MSSENIKITFLGDLMCQKEQNALVLSGSRSYDEIFSSVSKLFDDSDYVVGNLETPIAGEENLGYTSTHTCFNTPIAFVEAIKRAGIDFVSTGSNHCMDRGLLGIDSTIRALDSVGLEHSGTYLNEEDSARIFVKEIAGLRIAIVAPTYGVNSKYGRDPVPSDQEWKVDLLRRCDPLEDFQPPVNTVVREEKVSFYKRFLRTMLPGRLRAAIGAFRNYVPQAVKLPLKKIDRTIPVYQYDNVSRDEIGDLANDKYVARIRDKIEDAKKVSDFVVLYPHIGGQFAPVPGLYTKRTLKWMADMGVPLIIANHAHTPLRHEAYKSGAQVFYALGNFTFTPGCGWYVPGMLADYSIILNVYISKSLKRIVKQTFIPVKSIVDQDGFSRVVPVADLKKLYNEDSAEMESLVAENERLVNRICGGACTVDLINEYEV